MRLSPSVALLRTQADERLVTLARDGSEAAFTVLVERYRRPLLRACSRVLPEARAEDAVQQAFVAAWRALQRGDDVRDARAWLLRIARNTALNALRTPGYDYVELAESLEAGEAPQAELERRDVVRRTLAGLAGLPARQREALLASAVAGVSHADIARELGLSEGAARQLVLRARTTLRAAATAITPMPLINWAASAGSEAGLAAGAGALVAKAGAVALLAGGAVAVPAVVSHDAPRARAAAATVSGTAGEGPAGTATPAHTATAARLQAAGATPAARRTATPSGRPAASGRHHVRAQHRHHHGRPAGTGAPPVSAALPPAATGAHRGGSGQGHGGAGASHGHATQPVQPQRPTHAPTAHPHPAHPAQPARRPTAVPSVVATVAPSPAAANGLGHAPGPPAAAGQQGSAHGKGHGQRADTAAPIL